MGASTKLTDTEIRKAKAKVANGKTLRRVLSDGAGLRVVVDPSGGKSFDFRYVSPVTRKERTIGLGLYPAVSLDGARRKAQELRSKVAAGIDPLAEKDAQRAAAAAPVVEVMTVEKWCRDYIATHEGSWKNEVHRQQWKSTMESYVYPVIGSMAVAEVDTEAVLKVLNPIWSRIPESAMRVRGRLEMVLGAARAKGLRAGDNPAVWRGHLQHLLSRKPRGGHHEALPYRSAPEYWKSLREDTSQASRALQWTILTATRFTAAVEARWEEVDLERGTWTVPNARLKVEEEETEGFMVPLSTAALALIKQQGPRSEGLIFPSPYGGGALSYTSLLKVARKHAGEGDQEITTHGFRSSFRDWGQECTEADWDTLENCLQHRVGNKNQASYRRGTSPEKRAVVMQFWSDFLEGLRAAAA